MSLKEAIDNNEWVVVTGWTPHWKFAKYDLKYLEDPKRSMGSGNHQHYCETGTKRGFAGCFELFDNFAWSPEILLQQWYGRGACDPVKAAQQWIDQNQELVQSWLPEEYIHNTYFVY
jgi:glycine betaine/proline transport system substrate-binding protein